MRADSQWQYQRARQINIIELVIIAPWLIGVALPWLVLAGQGNRGPIAWFLSGLSGVLALTVTSWALRGFEYFGFTISSDDRSFQVVGLIAVFILCLAMIKVRHYALATARHRPIPFEYLLILPTSICAVYLSLSVPLHAWDSFGHWALRATHMLSALTTPGGDFEYYNRHPATLVHLNAWSVMHNGEISSRYAAPFALVWAMYVISALLILAAIGKQLRLSPLVTAMLLLGFITVPLIEAHWAIPGYAELPLGCAVLAATAAIYFYQIYPKQISLYVPVVAVTNVLFYKNIGIVFFSILLLALFTRYILSSKIAERYHKPVVQVSFLISVVILLLMLVGREIFWGGAEIAVTLEAFGRSLKLQPIDATTLLTIEGTALIYNQSFSVYLLLQIFCLLFCVLEYRSISKDRLFIAAAGFLFLMIHPLSLALDAAVRHAMPGLDTGHSRFMVVSVIGSFATIPMVVACMGNRAKALVDDVQC